MHLVWIAIDGKQDRYPLRYCGTSVLSDRRDPKF